MPGGGNGGAVAPPRTRPGCVTIPDWAAPMLGLVGKVADGRDDLVEEVSEKLGVIGGIGGGT